ncbi:hypothetical protein D9611_001714 [Ephemerocybe angulata]|uniref:Uncharacterized protein n=1 Tax=Ephemerocybe angulata TaxID=980116 RepID=A0A8H5CJS0_9AGAR|nr:hypothetical protein D9611_001706 [Tulosesus angulatus]KAF5342613.1 hypothetical protein D9611_001714 [Tulosesus angulatus]
MGTIVFSLLLLRQHREAMNLTFVAHRSLKTGPRVIGVDVRLAICSVNLVDDLLLCLLLALGDICGIRKGGVPRRLHGGLKEWGTKQTSKAVQSAKNRLSASVEQATEKEHRRSGSSMTVTGAEALPAYSAEARAMHKRKRSTLLVVGDWLGSLGHRKRDSTIEDGVSNGGVSERI